MKKVAIIGVGITPFKTRYLDKTYFELAYDATKLALEDANKNGAEITHKELESTVYGIYNELFERQFMPDIFINSYIGMNDKPGTRIASGGATGGYTVRMAYAEVALGSQIYVYALEWRNAMIVMMNKLGPLHLRYLTL